MFIDNESVNNALIIEESTFDTFAMEEIIKEENFLNNNFFETSGQDPILSRTYLHYNGPYNTVSPSTNQDGLAVMERPMSPRDSLALAMPEPEIWRPINSPMYSQVFDTLKTNNSIFGENSGFGDSCNDGIDDALLEAMPVRDLNKKLKGMPECNIAEMKRRRRMLKNRGYAENCRKKRQMEKTKLIDENKQLQKELVLVKTQLDLAKQEVKSLKQRCSYYGSGYSPTANVYASTDYGAGGGGYEYVSAASDSGIFRGGYSMVYQSSSCLHRVT